MAINDQILEALGLSLVHSLWQGAVLLFIVLLGLVSFRNRKARTRYGITLVGILMLPCILALNLVFNWPESSVDNPIASGAVSESSIMNLTTDFQSIPTNPQSSSTVLWLKQNASSIALIWLVGMSLFLLKVIGSFVWMRRLTAKAIPLKGEAINSLLNGVKDILGIRNEIRLQSSSWIKSPVILGFISPTILFPIGLIEGLSIEEVEAILYHELAHLKRNDFVINIIINVLQIVFFYHPAYWWMKSQLDNEREYATDEMALKYSNKKLPMIKALAKVQAFSMNQTAIGFAGNSKNQVLKRINIMMNSKQQPNWLSAIFTIALLLVAFGLMSVQDTEPRTEKKESESSITQYQTDSGSTPKGINDIDPKPQENDSLAVSKAILDLIQNRDSFEVKFDSSGKISSISKDGKQLSGEALKSYKSAWYQIDELNSRVKTQEEKLNEIQRREENLLKSLRESEKKIQGLNPSSLQRELIEVQKQLVSTQAEYERTLHKYNQTSSQAKEANEQELEEYKTKIKHLNEELERLSKSFHEKLTQREKVRYNLNNKYEVDSIWLDGKLLEGAEREFHLKNWRYREKEQLEKEYLRLQDSLKKVAYPGNIMDSVEVEYIKKYQSLIAPLEDKLILLNSKLIPDDQRKIESLERQIEEIKASLKAENEFTTLAFPSGKARLEFAKVFLVDKIHKNSLIHFDGQFRPSMKLADLTEKDIMTIESMDIIQGSKMLENAPSELLINKTQILRFNKSQQQAKEEILKKVKEINESIELEAKDRKIDLPGGGANTDIINLVILNFKASPPTTLIDFEGELIEWKDLKVGQRESARKIEILTGDDLNAYKPKRKIKDKEFIIKLSSKK